MATNSIIWDILLCVAGAILGYIVGAFVATTQMVKLMTQNCRVCRDEMKATKDLIMGMFARIGNKKEQKSK